MTRLLAKLSLTLVLLTSALWLLYPSHSSAQVSGAQNSINVETIAGPTVAEKIAESARETWPWYLSRGSGLLAAVSLVLLMLSGIGQITGHTYKFLEPLTAWASHRALGIVFGLSILAHIFSLLFDHFLKITLLEVLVPWLSDFKATTLLGRSVGSLYLALGIISFYLSIGIVVSSLIWISKKPHLWKFIHLASYILMALVFVHALFMGTDLAKGWPRFAWIGAGVSIAIGSIVRAWRAFTA